SPRTNQRRNWWQRRRRRDPWFANLHAAKSNEKIGTQIGSDMLQRLRAKEKSTPENSEPLRQAKEPLAKLNFDRMNRRYRIERTDAETTFQSECRKINPENSQILLRTNLCASLNER